MTLAPYAAMPAKSLGRQHEEPSAVERSCYQRDRDRIIHSTAFRRLEYKTQVFVYHEGDHYRNRLTHSMEVAQLTRDMCRTLKLEEDLGEAIALAHDLGHTPFGHAGEDALDDMMQPYGGFDHNAQTIRILTHLEQKYAAFDGLNLTHETLEGIAKHNGPVAHPPRALQSYAKQHDLQLHQHASLEAQIAAIADDIAYIAHDIEDGMRAGMLQLAQLRSWPLVGEVLAALQAEYPDLARHRTMYELRRRLIHQLVINVNETTRANIEQHKISNIEDIRNAGSTIATVSASMHAHMREIKAELMEHVYRHHSINRMTRNAKTIVKSLFSAYMEAENCLPEEWYKRVKNAASDTEKAIHIADYIAGMTDRFATEEYRKLMP